ncbi:hypothetical protein [Chryseobacterium oryctis]|uniref:Uncharacterized protein n=1 Tax=Chryseobacterium oryctis TaxID=2952618 RepID=A0ABT3HRY8_9FLAO|nr:hypothetical protein [Chryseobacterium oryctis]MCW3162543.1 hypothetical protein [Chryseobacterium oryctis]
MKKFIKYDYYAQLLFLIIGIVVAIVGGSNGWGILLFYFIVGIPQLISFLIKLFLKIPKSTSYIIYGIFILPVWLSFTVIIAFKQYNDITNFFGLIILAAFFYSPLLAIMYVYENYYSYKSLNPQQ